MPIYPQLWGYTGVGGHIKINKYFNTYYYENQKHFIYSAVFMELFIECTSKNGEMENL